MDGRADIVAQTPITVTGLRPELSGAWIVETAVHTQDYESGGFTTVLTGCRKAS
ncbi:MAG: hypothetical protein ACK4MY_05410 [Brevundimonas sp.]